MDTTTNNSIVFFSDDVRQYCICSYPDIWKKYYAGMRSVDILDLTPLKRNLFEYYMVLGLFYPDEFYRRVEIAIPPNRNHVSYIRDNILCYEHLTDRLPDSIRYMPLEYCRKFYEKLNDNMLISILGGYPVFQDRESLVNNIISLIDVDGWFVLLAPDKDKILNKDLITSNFSTLEELINDRDIILAYGNSSQYHFYELDELRKGIMYEQDEGIWLFKNAHGDDFKLIAIYRLLGLLQMLSDAKNSIVELIKHISCALNECKSYSKEENNLRKIYNNFTRDNKRKILKFLENILYMGMYMKQWEGPGYDYPIKQKDTFSDDMSYQIKITECRRVISEILEEFPICNEFYIMEKGVKSDRFGNLFSSAKEERYCIRVATRFISTAIWYRLLLTGETWPNIDINKIDQLSI